MFSQIGTYFCIVQAITPALLITASLSRSTFMSLQTLPLQMKISLAHSKLVKISLSRVVYGI